MFKVKVYKYDSTQETNGYRGEDFSSFVAQGEDLGEDITQIMDTAELTLYGLSQKQAFDPETKFIIDLVEYNPETQFEKIVTTIHRVVSIDTPNQPILSDDTYCDHHVSFIEPSVIAQKRLVDNIAATYKLKDVSIEQRPAFPDTQLKLYMGGLTEQPSNIFEKVNIVDEGGIYHFKSWEQHIGKYFQPEGTLEIVNSNGEHFSSQYLNINNFGDTEQKLARFSVPKLAIYCGLTGTKNYGFVGYASIDYLIEEFNTTEDYNPTNFWKGSFISNSNLNTNTNVYIPYRSQHGNYLQEWLIEGIASSSTGTTNDMTFKKYTDISASTPSYLTQEFPIQSNKRYKITISLHEFDNNISEELAKKYTGAYPTQENYMAGRTQLAGDYYVPNSERNKVTLMTPSQVTGSSFVATYDSTSATIAYQSSLPYSALALLQKAIINSGLYEKEDGVYIADINQSSLPFYIDPNFIGELSSTLIIENFYNQKNLWEIMVEVGNYIHAIPELKFGSNDRFMITFNRLGRTDEKQNNSTKLSIFNSRSVEDYISATSSYITNMVQLGGYIEEWVTPKTTSEQLLVSNDTAEIMVSKPIIELLDIYVRANKDVEVGGRTISAGTQAKLIDYIYEENVYKTLSIEYATVPNRGIALYYKLGTNIITGGDYQLPQANTNIYTDYAFKKVIWSAFFNYPSVAPAPTTGYWTDLKINDFSFFIRYRTKDSVRQNHIRPDLRKYLLNTKWDRYPEHNQFNNQTDVVVDSIKFGNNMFGKLIKTGNNSYDIYEWNDKWENVKHKGELYRLNGELYYVAKVMHTIYNSHIISKVSYSKDYNELSNVIGIPSEPRFYEISEQSLIWREFEINDVLLLTDDENQIEYQSNYVFNYDHLANLVIGEETDFAKYAVTVFKGDKDTGLYDQTIGQSDLYIEVINPINAYSSENTLTYEYDMEDNYSAGNKVIKTRKVDNIENYVGEMRGTSTPSSQSLTDFVQTTLSREPINGDNIVFILESTTNPNITYLYNYKNNKWHGSQIVDREIGKEPNKGSYNSLWAVKYTDIYGKATLMDFYILGGIGVPTPAETMAFPESHIDTKDNTATNFIGNYDILATNVKEFDTDFNGRGIGLLKDCREAMSINYNLRMATSSDTFVLSPYVYLPKKSNVRVVLLAEEVNKLSTGYIDNSQIITPIDKQGNAMNPYFEFDIIKTTATNSWDSTKSVVTKFGINLSQVFQNVADGHFTGAEGYQRVKAIAIICDVSLDTGLETENPVIPYKTQFIVARNIPAFWDRTKALKSLWWGSPKKDQVFKNKQ